MVSWALSKLPLTFVAWPFYVLAITFIPAGAVEICLPVFVDGVMSKGKPLRYGTVYSPIKNYLVFLTLLNFLIRNILSPCRYQYQRLYVVSLCLFSSPPSLLRGFLIFFMFVVNNVCLASSLLWFLLLLTNWRVSKDILMPRFSNKGILQNK